MNRPASPPTIRRTMGLVALAGVILGLLAAAARRDVPIGFVAACILVALVILIPVHFAIEGNRRDDAGRG